MDDLRTQQSAQLIRSDCDLKELLRVHERTSASVRATHGDADALIRGIVLEPAQIARVRTIRENLSALLVRLRVLWREASLYAGTASSSSDAWYVFHNNNLIYSNCCNFIIIIYLAMVL